MVNYEVQGDIPVGWDVNDKTGRGRVADVGVNQVDWVCIQVWLDSLPSFEYLGPEGIAQSQA